MGDASLQAEVAEPPPVRSREPYSEQLFFERSPFNLWLTTALIYVACMAAYLLATGVDHVTWYAADGGGFSLVHGAQIAFTLPLIACSSLALQRFSRLRELADAPNFEKALRPGFHWEPSFPRRRLQAVTAIGAALGVATILFIQPWRQAGGLHPTVVGWFFVATGGLMILFLRGLVLTAAGAGHARQVIRHGLDVDLLRIERLYPWGRAAARTALVWFAVSAAALLLIADSGLTIYTVPLLVGCVGMGVWAFMSTLAGVHDRICATKAVELEALRDEIGQTRGRLDADGAAPAKLQSLLAYEARIAAAPEWPFDQTILARFGASSLILAIPWFGQAVAQLVVENLGKMAR